MKRLLVAAAFLLLSLPLSFAQKTVHSFKEALEAEDGCIVKVKKATILAASADYSVVYDGETSIFVASSCLFSLQRGDVISMTGERTTHRGLFPAIRCIEHKQVHAHGNLPPEDLQEIYSVHHATSPIPVKASGILTCVDDHFYLYTPDQLSPITHTRVELICSAGFVDELAAHQSEHIQVSGYFIKEVDGNIPLSLMLTHSIEKVPHSTLKTLSTTSHLEKGERARLVATVSAVDSLGFEICDFSGTARLPRMGGPGISPGKRVLLGLSQNDDNSEPDLSGFKLFEGKSYPDTVTLYQRLGGRSYVKYGNFEWAEGGYLMKGVPFNGTSSYALEESGQNHLKITPLDYRIGKTVFLGRSLERAHLKDGEIPRGVYDIRYFPEAEAIVFQISDIPFDGLYPGDDLEDEEAIPFQGVEQKPSFMGGDANVFSKWVNERLRYPAEAKRDGIQGRVTLQFTIEADGYVTHVRVLRGAHPLLDNEAVRVVSRSPRWEPGYDNGRPVRVTYSFPIFFGLR